MTHKLRLWLYQLADNLRLNPVEEKEIVSEFRSHFEDRIEELTGKGLSREEAEQATEESFGPAGSIARELNEAYGRGSWGETLASSLPHFFFALLFIFHLWQNFNWRLVGLLSILIIVIYGWRHEKPNWYFSWLGYLLVPFWIVLVLAVWFIGRSLGLFPHGNFTGAWWFWPIIVLMLPVIGWVFISVVTQTVKRDWLLTSLMGLPFPALAIWLIASVSRNEAYTLTQINDIRDLDLWMAVIFTTIAVLVGFFSRVRRRTLKTATLLFACVVILVIMVQYKGIELSFIALTVILALTLLGLFIVPVLLEHRLGHGSIDLSSSDIVEARQIFHKS